jgi:hypothetical protein
LEEWQIHEVLIARAMSHFPKRDVAGEGTIIICDVHHGTQPSYLHGDMGNFDNSGQESLKVFL